MQMFEMMNDKDELMLPRCNTDKTQTKVFANRVMLYQRSFQNEIALFDTRCVQLYDLSNQLKW